MKKLLGLFVCVLLVLAAGCDGGGAKAVAEVCDGLDNDRNDLIDDGLQRICQTDCGMGVESCQAGVWVGCSAAAPGVESCNGLDDDCDGCFDEGPGDACPPLEQPCATACGNGTEYCYMGSWQACSAEEPGDEVCDGLDNDCDGQTDEGLDVDTDGDSHYTTDSCAQPNDDCNDSDANIHGGHAEDCDGKDNDCNQQIDEGCDCTPGGNQTCGSDVGECSVGSQDCLADGSWGPCQDGQGIAVLLPAAQAELCNNRDDDCDGETDEGNPEGGEVCGTDEGVCETGLGVCMAGVLDCQGGVQAGDEICNQVGAGHLDDDCDGLTDEGLVADNYENNDSCNLGRGLSLYSGDNNVLSAMKTLYKFEGGQFGLDEDWFCLNATESSSFCLPGDPQCMQMTLRLDLPQGADHSAWEVCLYDHGGATGSCTDNCDSPLVEICTDPDVHWIGSFYQLDVNWSGDCLFTDNRFIAVVVRGANGATIADCNPYTLTLGLDKLGQDCP